MDEILIIEDQLKMVQIIYKYLNKLNPRITEDSVYCYLISDKKVEIVLLKDITNEKIENNEIQHFRGNQEEVIKKMIDFISRHKKNSIVFVMVDVLLNSLDASVPTYTKYRQDDEYSDQIYLELLKGMYDEKYQEEKNINPDCYDYILFSRSSASRSIMARLLKEHFVKLQKESEETGKTNALNFPFYLEENINWCKNRCEQTTVAGQPEEVNPPLDLEEEYVEYIKKDLFKKKKEGRSSGKM